jgi:hypothetical protein
MPSKVQKSKTTLHQVRVRVRARDECVFLILVQVQKVLIIIHPSSMHPSITILFNSSLSHPHPNINKYPNVCMIRSEKGQNYEKVHQVRVRARGMCEFLIHAGPRYHQVQKVLIIIIHPSIHASINI